MMAVNVCCFGRFHSMFHFVQCTLIWYT